MYLYHDYSNTLVPDLITTRGPLPTWYFPVSVPSSPSSVQVHPPTWALPISIPESPTPQYSIPNVTPVPYCVFLSNRQILLAFPLYFIQGCPKLYLLRLLMPPCVPPVSSSLISLLFSAHLKNRPQHHPLYTVPCLLPM